MFKLLLFLGVIIAAFKFTPLGDFVWANTIEVVNPAAKEAKVLGQLKTQLDTISNTVNQSSFASLSNTDKAKKINDLVAQANNTVAEAQDIAKKSDLVATINTAVKSFLPGADSQTCKP